MAIRLYCLAATAALTMATGAAAQTAGEQQGKWRQAMQARMAERQAEASRDIAILLDIKPAQQAALTAYLASMAPPPREAPATRPAPAQTEPERLDRMSAMMQRRSARMQTRIEATRRLYAALDSHQQQRFDALMRLRRAARPRMRTGMGRRFAAAGFPDAGPGE
jgi:hypothetical protein